MSKSGKEIMVDSIKSKLLYYLYSKGDKVEILREALDDVQTLLDWEIRVAEESSKNP